MLFQDYQKLTREKIAALPLDEQQRRFHKHRRQPRPQHEGRQEATTATETGETTLGATDFRMVARASLALLRLSPERAERYEQWVAVGMALCEFGRIGFNLWDEWSRQSAKYDAGACAEKWPTFTPATSDRELTARSLDAWADEDDPGGSSVLPSDERRQLDEYKRIEQWQAHVLHNKDLCAFDKVTMLVSRPVIEVGRDLVDRQMPDGGIPVNYGHIAELMGASDKAVGKSFKRTEEAGMWRLDPEKVPSGKGFDILKMRVQPLEAFDNPKLLTPVAKPWGGARPGAGRKLKCPMGCADETPIVEEVTTVKTLYCGGCHTILHSETKQTSREVAPEFNQVIPGETEQGEVEEIQVIPREQVSSDEPMNQVIPREDAPRSVEVLTMVTPTEQQAPLLIDVSNPAALPGVRTGLIAPDDPWILYQQTLAGKAATL